MVGVTYILHCPTCRATFEGEVAVAVREVQLCGVCGTLLSRNFKAEIPSKVIGIPKNLHTSFSDVHGKPGSPQREAFDRDVKSGKIQYAGPGSRWV